MNRLVFLLCLALVLNSASSSIFSKLYKVDEKIQRDFQLDELNEPHYFTEYIEVGDIETAKSKGLVDLSSELLGQGSNAVQDFISYAGYFTVDKECNSNLFGWFFKNKNQSAPVLLWLQGGPGGSSMFGLFTETGPYFVDQDLKLTLREYAWTKKYSVLFVDNPVGTGFSFTDKDECYARNEDHVSSNLFSLLVQFFSMFPDLKQNEFYLTGESYAGKYIPYLAYTINERKKFASKFFNFRGMAIGDGWTDPINQINYDELLYQIGLIDMNQKAILKQKAQEINVLINKADWIPAFDGINELLDGDLNQTSLYSNFTGLKTYFNFLLTNEPPAQSYWQKYVIQDKIRNLINIGNHTFNDGSKVEYFMREDFAKSVAPQLIEILRNDYKVLLYNGQLDICVGPVLTQNFLSKLKWEGVNSYLKAPRKIWKVNKNDSEIAGYVKSVFKSKTKQFHYVTVRDAGHILPFDQPRAASDLIDKFINNQLHQV